MNFDLDQNYELYFVGSRLDSIVWSAAKQVKSLEYLLPWHTCVLWSLPVSTLPCDKIQHIDFGQYAHR